MGLPATKVADGFRFIELPEEVWKVHLLPARVPIPEDNLDPTQLGGFSYDKLFEFVRSYLDETQNYEDIVFYEKATNVYKTGTHAIFLHRQGKFKEAIKKYQQVLNEEPGSWICWYNQSFCYLQLEESDKAMECLEKAIGTLSQEPRNYALLGDIFIQQKKMVQAYGAYHQFLRYVRMYGGFTNVAFQLRYQLGILEQKEPALQNLYPWPFDSRCICGEHFSFPQTCPGSESQPHTFKDLRFSRPSDWTLQGGLECHVCQFKLENAHCTNCGRDYHWGVGTLKTYHPVDELISIQGSYFDYGGEDRKSKTDVESFLQDAYFALLEFRYQDALNVLYRASHLIFDNPIFHYKLTEVMKLMGREVEGVNHYENILKIHPESIQARYGLALLAPNPTVATRIYQEIILTDRSFAPAYAGLGDVLVEEGQTKEALDYFQRALDLDPTWIPVLRSLAVLYQNLGDETQSVHFRNALHRLSPYFDDRHENAYLAFAGKLRNQKEYGRANEILFSISEIARAAVTTEEQRVHFELGFEPWLKVKRISNLVQMGQTWMAEEMLGQLTKAIEGASANTREAGVGPDLRLNLVKTLIDEGLDEEANAYLEKTTKAKESPLDEVAVDWLKNYEQDKRKMHRMLCGDHQLSMREVASFAMRTHAEVQKPGKGSAYFIDGEGLMVTLASSVGEASEVNIVTYDGLELPAKVVARCATMPIVFLKAPALGEGQYFHFDLNAIPVLQVRESILVFGQDPSGDYAFSETHIKQDFLDSQGIRYLLLDRAVVPEDGGGLVLTSRGAVIGITLTGEFSDPEMKSRIVLDSDEIARFASMILKDYLFIYSSEFCTHCGRRLRLLQSGCACGHTESKS